MTNKLLDLPDRFSQAAWLRLGWAYVGLGVLARLVQWLWGVSYWSDEAMLLLNFRTADPPAIFGALQHGQTAPPLFALLQNAAFDAFGTFEQGTRLVALLAGCCACVLIWLLARRLLPLPAAVLCAGIFAFSGRLTWHAAEAKQYSTDVLLATVLLLVATWPGKTATWRVLAAGTTGVVGVWLSHPSVFMVPAVGLALLPMAWREGVRGRWVWAGVTAACAASFAAVYLLSIRHQQVPYLFEYWFAGGKFPDYARPWGIPAWVARSTLGVVNYPYENVSAVLLPAALLGCVAAVRRGRRGSGHGRLLAMAGMPVLFVLIAAFALRYPFGGSRVTAFLTPGVTLLVGLGFDSALRTVRRAWQRRIVWAVTSVVLLLMAGPMLWRFAEPEHRGHLAPAVRHVQANAQDQEPIFVIDEAAAFRVYWPGRSFTLLEPPAAETIEVRRFWLVWSFDGDAGRRKVSRVLDTLDTRYDRTDAFVIPGGGAILYERAIEP
ncbi:MAG: glycosyltransferase family 39 protein [Phycisphaerae bacterium]